MKRALIYAHTASMILQFNMENIRTLRSMGYAVEAACNFEEGNSIPPQKIAEMKVQLEEMGVTLHHLPVPRKVTAVFRIIKSIGLTRKLMNERCYDLVHCHSPVGSVVCRVANRLSKAYGKCRMIYTAHGFHFYKGAPLKILFFEEGAPFTLYGQSMIKGKEQRTAVKEVFDFLINEYNYENNEKFFPEQIYKDKIYTVENYPQDIPYADMSNNTIDQKEALLEKWNH